jgi:hypothetical protein
MLPNKEGGTNGIGGGNTGFIIPFSGFPCND